MHLPHSKRRVDEADVEFAEEAIRRDIVQPQELLRRVVDLPVGEHQARHQGV